MTEGSGTKFSLSAECEQSPKDCKEPSRCTGNDDPKRMVILARLKLQDRERS